MKFTNTMICLMAAATLATGCKNDSEEDLLPPDGDADYTHILLNEICGAGAESEDPNGEADWIEIYNAGTETVNLGGVTVEKTDEEGHVEVVCTFSTTREIASGVYLVLNYPTELSAKISNKKPVAITLRTPSGDVIDVFDRDTEIEEGTGLADDFGNRKGHRPGGSYARIPNGGNDWAVVGSATPGAENVADEDDGEGNADSPVFDPSAVKDYSGLVLNELNGNKPVKFIEICNTLDKAVDLEGVMLRKNDEDPVIWVAPKISIGANGRLVLVSDQETNNTAAGFEGGLSAKKSVKIELLDPAGGLLDVFKNLSADRTETWDAAPLYNGETNVESFGRWPDATGEWFTMNPSQGTANAEGNEAISMEAQPAVPGEDGGYEGLVLNELNGNDKFIELYNASDKEIDLSGVQLKKDDEDIIWIAPEGTVIAARGFFALDGEAGDYTGGFTSGLSADKSVKIELLTPSGQEIDVFKNLSESKGEVWGEKDGKYDAKSDKLSFSRFPDGTGKWYLAEKSKDKNNFTGTIEIKW